MATRHTRKENPDAARHILQAADELLGERGFDGVSVADIASRAGVSKMMVFYYFGSKETLFEKVLEPYYAAHLSALEEAFARKGALEERLHGLVDGYFDFINENRRYARLTQQMVAGDTTHHALLRRNMAPFTQGVLKLLKEATAPDGPLAARQFFVTFSGMVINYFTYAPVFEGLWKKDPFSPQALAERRAHLHWMTDAMLAKLAQDNAAPTKPAKPPKRGRQV